MRTTLNILFSLLLLVGITGCAKHELDVAELTTNPFDPDYVGADIFSVVSTTTSTYTVEGVEYQRLNMRVKVHTELFPRISTYLVDQDGAPVIASSSMPDNELTVQFQDVDPGVTYCRRLYLYNDGVRGGSNEVCGTAE